MERKKILIYGHVQGIFFRAYIKKLAQELNLKGIVRNLPDGKVEIITEGEKENIKKLIELCKEGPKTAQVKKITIIEEKPKNEFKNFEIIY